MNTPTINPDRQQYLAQFILNPILSELANLSEDEQLYVIENTQDIEFLVQVSMGNY